MKKKPQFIEKGGILRGKLGSSNEETKGYIWPMRQERSSTEGKAKTRHEEFGGIPSLPGPEHPEKPEVWGSSVSQQGLEGSSDKSHLFTWALSTV